MSISRARAKKILLSLDKTQHGVDDANNPDSILFESHQFPKPYDDFLNINEDTNHAYTTSYTNNFTECDLQENETDNSPTMPSSSFANNFRVSYQEKQKEIDFEPILIEDGQITQFELVEDAVIEHINISQQSEDKLTEFNRSYQTADDENIFIDLENSQSILLNNSDAFQNETTLALSSEEHRSADVQTITSSKNQQKLVDYSDSDSTTDEPKIKRKKRCQVKKEQWSEEINKKNREQGREYSGKRKIDDKWKKDIKRPKKTIKPRCTCKKNEKSVIQCHKISEEDRKEMFDTFWHMTWDEKRVYIKSLIKKTHTDRQRDRKDPKKSKRINTMVYFLKKNDETIRVCKTLFLNTFCIGKTCLWSWKVGKSVKDNFEGKDKHNNEEQNEHETQTRKLPFDKEVNNLHSFLDSLPKMPSHYCRKRTTQSYLQPDFTCKRQLYDCYAEQCKTQNAKPLSIATFSNTLAIKKISLFKPKKDLCEICNNFKLGHISEAEHQKHVEKKEEARREKELDKETKEFVFTADLQAVLLAPRSNVSTNYYKTKLCVHNWCIYDMKSGDGYCFIWNEAEGGLNSDEFASIITSFLIKTVIPKMGENDREITLYTDGCTYQNRNVILSNSLVNLAMIHNVTITQKYLEVGHTQMEVDSMHAMIEKKLKNQVINVPAEYITVCKKAKKHNPYEVEYLYHSYFKNFKDLKFYKSIRPGRVKGDSKVRA